MNKKEKINAKVSYFYFVANDLKAMRHFYTTLIGLPESAYFEDEQIGYLCYQMEGFEMMWFRSVKKVPIQTDWAMQPGYPGGLTQEPSWSIEVDEKDFYQIVEKIKKTNIPVFQKDPEYRQNSYWGFSVRDPMGYTVELYFISSKENTEKQ